MLPAVRSGAKCFSARSRGARAGLPLARQAAPEQSRQCEAQCAWVSAWVCVRARVCVCRAWVCVRVRESAVVRACVRVMSPSAPPTPISSWYARKCSACALSRSGETTPDELDRPSCLRSDSASPPPTHKARPLALARAAGMLHLPVSPRLSPHLERPGCRERRWSKNEPVIGKVAAIWSSDGGGSRASLATWESALGNQLPRPASQPEVPVLSDLAWLAWCASTGAAESTTSLRRT